MNADDLLRYLLSVDDPRLAPLKVALADSIPVFLDTSTGDGTPLLRIYSTKAGIAKDRSSSTAGYDDLLRNLENARKRQVTVVHVNTETKAFLIFTDAEDKRVFGMFSGNRKT